VLLVVVAAQMSFTSVLLSRHTKLFPAIVKQQYSVHAVVLTDLFSGLIRMSYLVSLVRGHSLEGAHTSATAQ